jgi:putative flippase GtrA
MDVAILVPAYRPGPSLVRLAEALAPADPAGIIVVDDGSGPDFNPIFAACERVSGVQVLRHAVNLGKGAALKTGINHVLCTLADCKGVVTADADGQHAPQDVLAIARRIGETPGELVLGARDFDGRVPWRSRLGNVLTRTIARLLLGHPFRDTQTGLRGIPRELLPRLLAIASSGYEFELDMLIAARHAGYPVVEQPIRTIYEDRNASSHFNPLKDSMRIYFVLFRFGLLSLLTACVDNAFFYLAYRWTSRLLEAQAIGRAAAVLFNYTAARRAVFLSRERHRTTLPRYLLLVAFSGAVSYTLIDFLHSRFGIPVIQAKLAAEGLLFIANFAVQRDFVFRRRTQAEATDWDRYYRSTPFTAKLTRRYTRRVLVSTLRKSGLGKGGTIVEIGGANSCFVDGILAELSPGRYHVIDTNQYGLDLLRGRLDQHAPVVLERGDVLTTPPALDADAVFSVGLIEHFDPERTRTAVLNHLSLVKPGGCLILSFPTPTWLYRTARYVTELAGAWKFPDERPLQAAEVLDTLHSRGEIIFEKTLWPLVFTQHLIALRKPPA